MRRVGNRSPAALLLAQEPNKLSFFYPFDPFTGSFLFEGAPCVAPMVLRRDPRHRGRARRYLCRGRGHWRAPAAPRWDVGIS